MSHPFAKHALILLGVTFALQLMASEGKPLETKAKKSGDEKIEFNRDIRPILADNCYTCHGPDKNKRKAGLRLDQKEGALAKLKEGNFAIVPGDVSKSSLYQRIISKDEEERMPPSKGAKQLTDAQIETLKKWIEQGAEWQPHWSFITPVKPQAEATAKVNPIDTFIVARLNKEGLKPSAEADRVTLIRRLSFDLTGLPPTSAEVESFLNDKSDNAYEKVVDRLLASPHYGERLAVYWLDLVRYADSIGYHSDNPRNVTPYRDYVINAFNSNMHFDQFTTEQLAGDLLPNSTLWQKVASGYNRLLQTTEEGGAQAKEYEAKNASDRVRNFSSVWLGATMGCCECHDHKFDPYTMKDFYSLAAFFADVKEGAIGRREDGMLVPTAEQEIDLKKIDDEIAAIKKQIDTPTPELEKAQQEWEKAQKAVKTAEWTALTVLSAESEGGATMKIKDNVVAVSGKNPDKDTYKVTCKTKLKDITALRLDVLPDKSLPANGPGRAGNGNFVLSEFEAKIGDKTIKFNAATATHSQNDFNISNTIDGKLETGWAILDHTGKDTQAVFECAENIGGDAETTIVITIKHNYGSNHAIGRFTLFTTSAERPVKASGAMGLPKEVADILAIDADKRNDAQKQKLAAHFRSVTPALHTLRENLKQVEAKKTELEKKVPRCLVSMSDNPRTVRIKPRGNWMDDSGEVCTPQVPHNLNPIPCEPNKRLTRLDLAKWLIAPENPLTARVFANRMWKLFFGQGISKTQEDLGAQGEWPSHPELIDFIAVDFRENNWDVKRLIKQMVMSKTYRQTSTVTPDLKEKDPYNRFLARQSRFRLDAEFIRDNALAVSGLLVPKIGGPSVKPYQPAGYWQHLNFPTRNWDADKGEGLYRRGLYTWWQRSFLHPSLLNFDATSREECCADRPRSNTPQQALTLLNDPTYVEAARAFAAKIIQNGGKDFDSRIAFSYQQALARKPKPEEISVLREVFDKHLQQYTQDKEAAKKVLAVGEFPAPKDLDQSELAAWTSTARVIFNLHEFITRE